MVKVQGEEAPAAAIRLRTTSGLTVGGRRKEETKRRALSEFLIKTAASEASPTSLKQ